MINVDYLLVIFVFSILFVTIPAYAENPTPYNEWDFDFVEIEISQDPGNLKTMTIIPRVLFEGDMPLGTVNISAHIKGPDGKEFTHFGTIRDMSNGDIRFVRLTHSMPQEGTYTINLNMTPPEEPYLDHIFDTETVTFEVEKNGFEKEVEVIGTDSEEIITYMIENPASVKYYESVHAEINLPKEHTFEKITVTNDEFEHDFAIDIQDIYLESQSGFSNLKVNLVKEGNFLPMADAQNSVHDYVKFYKVNKDVCSSMNCININHKEKMEEFPLWALGFLVLIVLVMIPVYRKNKNDTPRKKWGSPYIEK